MGKAGQGMATQGSAELIEAMIPLLRIQPVFEDFCRFGGSWESPHAPNGRGWAQFHIVTRGSCRIERPGLDDLTLEAGDILLLPHGDSHVVRSRLQGVMRPVNTEMRNGIRRRLTSEPLQDTELMCGRFLFEAPQDNPLLTSLPNEILLRSTSEPLLERFRRLLFDIRDELDGGKPGAEIIAADFARALFVMMLRDYLAEAPVEDGMVSLLRDRTTARVVLALLKDLSRDWTLDEMADVGVTSRATLIRAFRRHADTAPMTFLSELRLSTARRRLAGTQEPVASIAADVGYATESALSKAILRQYGVRPGALRISVPSVPSPQAGMRLHPPF